MPRIAPENIIIRPILTEKSWREMEAGKYTFEVHPDAGSRGPSAVRAGLAP